MGAYSPAPILTPALEREVRRLVVEPFLAGLGLEEIRFRGLLYPGLMIGRGGLKVLEFNCRFGDPETQVILPLLESDLLDVVEACTLGQLNALDVKWRAGAAACVVLASEGYPGKYPSGCEIRGLNTSFANAVVFHAGTKLSEGKVVTAGGRVLGVAGLGADFREAIDRAYGAVRMIEFEGMQYRRDIGYRALNG
jgi:phosphoribosylamine--glycine ligase